MEKSLIRVGKNTIDINFKEILEIEEDYDSSINKFCLSKKRIYVGVIDLVALELSNAFSYDNDTIIKYFNISKKIYSYKKFLEENNKQVDYYKHNIESNSLFENYEPKNFYIDLLDLSNDLYEFYNELVDSEFSLVLSDDYKDELLFEENHIKAILSSSCLIRFLIPLFLSYASATKIKDIDTLLIDLIITFLNKFSMFYSLDINLPNKLFKLIASRVNPTIYSDKVIWSYLTNIGSTPPEYISASFRKILIDHLPKLTLDKNPIIYFHVVLKNLIKYQFQTNFPINYKPLTANNEISEETVFDKKHFSLNNCELNSSLSKLHINDCLANVKKISKKDITIEEISYYYDNLQITKAHTILMYIFYTEYISDQNIINNASSKDFYALLIHLLEVIKLEKLELLYSILLSNSNLDEPIKLRKNNEKNEDYLEFISKYKDTSNKIEKSSIGNIILADLTCFTKLLINPYENQNNDLDELIFDNKELEKEIIIFLTKFVK
jgi:hypothetical protein